jgi:protein-tyrosine-phosphatase
MKRTQIKSKSDRPKRTKGLFDHLKKESKDAEWSRIKRDILDPYFYSIALLSTCELGFDGCVGSYLPLQYAHSKKREEIAKYEPERTRELCEVIRVCTACHDKIEHPKGLKGKEAKEYMYRMVTQTIESRNRALAKWEKIIA